MSDDTKPGVEGQISEPPDPITGARTGGHSSRFTQTFFILSAGLSFYMFFESARMGEHWSRLDQDFLLLSPCLIFLVTTLVYYLFITDYTGEVAGLSFCGLFVALFCCIRLSEPSNSPWEDHLKYLYMLFLSYVIWDCLMLGWFLPAEQKDARHEIEVLSTHVNQPTLVTILVIWIVAHSVQTEIAENYVDGVVAFHLMFAFFACIRTLAFWRHKW